MTNCKLFLVACLLILIQVECSNENNSSTVDQGIYSDQTTGSDLAVSSDAQKEQGVNQDQMTADAEVNTTPPGCVKRCFDISPFLCALNPVGKCIECMSDQDCQNNPHALGPKCDTKSGYCICEGDNDCASNSNGKVCDTNNGACSCEKDTDCATPEKCVGLNYDIPACDTPCTKDADCKSPYSPKCDTSKGRCVTCLKTEDCADHPFGAVCSNQECTCQTNDDCKSTKALGKTCIGTNAKRCGCTDDNACDGNLNGPTCSLKQNTYFCACNADQECKTAPYSKCYFPLGSADDKRCQKPCTKDTECSPSFPSCDTASGKCVACLKDEDCSKSQTLPFCSAKLGACVECKQSTDCKDPLKPFCHPDTQKCMECGADKDCSLRPETPLCDTTKNKCVQCFGNDDCKSSPHGRTCKSNVCTCTDDNTCKGDYFWGNQCSDLGSVSMCRCQTSDDCKDNMNGSTCYTMWNKCSCSDDGDCKTDPYVKCAFPYDTATYKHCQKACASDADCNYTMPKCDKSTGKCYACEKDADCTDPKAPFCSTSRKTCVACKANTDCTDPKKPQCLESTGQCAACKEDNHCTDQSSPTYNEKTPFCSVATGNCINCKSNPDCSANPYNKVCDSLVGCIECYKNSDCTADMLGSVCNINYICTCTEEAQCATNVHGKKCDMYANICSCETNDDCSNGKKCVGTFMGVPVCKDPCKEDKDCAETPSTPACNTTTGACVKCTNATHCTDDSKGLACTDKNVCGCQTDSDCKGPYPNGNFCDNGTSSCGCTKDAECNGNPHGPTCDLNYGRCSCATSQDCTTQPYTVCGRNSIISMFKDCKKPCAKDEDCAPFLGFSKCNTSTGECVSP